MRALVTAEFTEGGVRRLQALGYDVARAGWGVTGQVLDQDALVEAARGAQLLVVEVEVVDEALLAQLPDLRVVATARGGPVNVDAAACAARGIPVLHTPGRNADSVADFTLGLLLSLLRGVHRADAHLRGTGWHVGDALPYLHFRGPELGSLTVGLIGLGEVGSRVRTRLEGFGATVVFTDPRVPGGTGLDELLAVSDVVSLHCPRGPGLVLDVTRVKQGGWVVNTAGGGMLDEDALVDALEAGRLAGAALDVFATEPLPRDSRLLTAPGLLLTPHLAGAAHDVVRHHTDQLCEQVERLSRA